MPRAAKVLEGLKGLQPIPKPKLKRKIGDVVQFDEIAYMGALNGGVPLDWKFDPGIQFAPIPNAPLPEPPKVEALVKNYRAHIEKCFSQRHHYPSRWVIATVKTYREFPNEICHAGLKAIPDDVTLFASNFGVHPGMEEVGEAYWQFMIGPRSPWRSLYEHGVPEKLFFEDGLQSGFIMNNIDIVDEKKTTLIYNYCIAMRMIHEYPKTIQSWFDVQKFGLDEIEALYFARIFQTLENHLGYVVLTGTNDGCHWPFWFKGAEYSWNDNPKYRYINFDRLYEGRPNFKGKSCQQWTEEKLKGNFKDFSTKLELEVVTQGKFSKVHGYPLEKLVPEFKAWMQGYREDVRKALGEVKDVPEPEVQPVAKEVEIEDDYDEYEDDDYHEEEFEEGNEDE